MYARSTNVRAMALELVCCGPLQTPGRRLKMERDLVRSGVQTRTQS